jgi:hypothetical protein
MKTKAAFLTFTISALLVSIVFIILKAYFTAAVVFIGLLILGHRELWALISRRKLPPIDERVSENVNRAIRNSFAFFIMVSIITMFLYISDQQYIFRPLDFLGALLLSVGLVYAVSYLFYDRIEAKFDSRQIKTLRMLLITVVVSALVFIIDAFFINRLVSFTFHIVLLYVSALAFTIGIIGCTTIFLKGLLSRS